MVKKMDDVFLTAQEVAEILHVAKSTAYEIFHREDFPLLIINNLVRVSKKDFYEWIDKQKVSEQKVTNAKEHTQIAKANNQQLVISAFKDEFSDLIDKYNDISKVYETVMQNLSTTKLAKILSKKLQNVSVRTIQRYFNDPEFIKFLNESE